MAFHGITYLLAPARFAAFRGQVEPRSAAAPPRALGFNTVSTKLRAPFACFAAASPPDRTEKISAQVACGCGPDPVLFEKPLALFFRQSHASIPETGDCRTVFLANFECENRGTCGRASEEVFGTARMISRITRHPLRGLLQRVAASASSRRTKPVRYVSSPPNRRCAPHSRATRERKRP
jgi:hypothetical protein